MTSYYNSTNGQISLKSPENVDYGIKHYCNDGKTPTIGMHEVSYKPEVSTLPERDKYLDKYGPVALTPYMLEKVGGIHFDWPVVSPRDFINVACLVRRFLLADFSEKKEILLNKLGFHDAAVSVNGDNLYVYSYSREPTQVKLYLKSGVVSKVTEINRVNNSKLEELLVSLDFNGIHYLFCQIFADLNCVSFSKLEAKELGNINVTIYQKLIDFSSSFHEVDSIEIKEINHFLPNKECVTTENKEQYEAIKSSFLVSYILIATSEGTVEKEKRLKLVELISSPSLFLSKKVIYALTQLWEEDCNYLSSQIEHIIENVIELKPNYLEEIKNYSLFFNSSFSKHDSILIKQDIVNFMTDIAKYCGRNNICLRGETSKEEDNVVEFVKNIFEI